MSQSLNVLKELDRLHVNNINSPDATLEICTQAAARTVSIGNATGASKLVLRYGTGGKVESGPANASVTTTATLTVANLVTGVVVASRGASTSVTHTLPTPTSVVSVLSAAVGDHIDFSVINIRTESSALVTLNTQAGGTVTKKGSLVVKSAGATGASSGSGLFRIRVTNVTSGSEAYTLYRLC